MARPCHKEGDTPLRRWLCLMLAVLGTLCALAGCARSTVKAANAIYPAERGDFPRSIAILPFTNQTSTPGIDEEMRVEFYGHMSALPFKDVELNVIDDTLGRRGLSSPKALSQVSVKALGRLLGCDAVLFGNVFEFQRVYAGLYSSMNVGLSIKIWDTRTSEIVWSDRYTARIHEGGVPLTLMDLPMITLRSGMNLSNTVKLHAMDETCRYLVRRIPTPKTVTPVTPAGYTLQIGAFSSEERALSVKYRFKHDGFPVFIRQSRDDRGLWHRVLLGPYKSLENALEVQRKLRDNHQTDSLVSPNRS